MKPFRRRRFVVKKKFQFELLSISLLYIGLFVLVLAITLFLPLLMKMETKDYASKEVFQAAGQLLYLHDHFWPPVVLTLILISLHSLRTSHRVAGALYRFDQVFKSLKEGVLPASVRLRKDDFLMKEAEGINQMLASFRSKSADIQQTRNTLKASIATCLQVSDETSKEELLDRLRALARTEAELESKLAFFTIPQEEIPDASEESRSQEGHVKASPAS